MNELGFCRIEYKKNSTCLLTSIKDEYLVFTSYILQVCLQFKFKGAKVVYNYINSFPFILYNIRWVQRCYSDAWGVLFSFSLPLCKLYFTYVLTFFFVRFFILYVLSTTFIRFSQLQGWILNVLQGGVNPEKIWTIIC